MSAVVLANLCVSYIMTTQNEEVLHGHTVIFSNSPSSLLQIRAPSDSVVFVGLSVSSSPRLRQAEELIRKIEKEEEQISYDDPDKKVFHLCIVNLVIG